MAKENASNLFMIYVNSKGQPKLLTGSSYQVIMTVGLVTLPVFFLLTESDTRNNLFYQTKEFAIISTIWQTFFSLKDLFINNT